VQKANSYASEETILIKAMKYFDLNNSGTINVREFSQAIEKIGILIFDQNVSLFGAEILWAEKNILMAIL
jgi:Ca2+-binding EF-hand superfamily protein